MIDNNSIGQLEININAKAENGGTGVLHGQVIRVKALDADAAQLLVDSLRVGLQRTTDHYDVVGRFTVSVYF